MARVTVEDCLENVENHFELVHLASRRVRQIRGGAPVYSDRNNKDIVLSLREIAAGDVLVKNIQDLDPRPRDEMELMSEFDSDPEDNS